MTIAMMMIYKVAVAKAGCDDGEMQALENLLRCKQAPTNTSCS